MHMIMSHGLEGHAHGAKLRLLAAVAVSRGVSVDSIAYRFAGNADAAATEVDAQGAPMRDPSDRLPLLLEKLKQRKNTYPDEPIVLLGSSMGAWVSAAAAQRVPVEGLFLLSPPLGSSRPWREHVK